jgi:hypothetical protein
MEQPKLCTSIYFRGKHRGEVCRKPVVDEETMSCKHHASCKFSKVGFSQCSFVKKSKGIQTQCPNVGRYSLGYCPNHSYKSHQSQTAEEVAKVLLDDNKVEIADTTGVIAGVTAGVAGVNLGTTNSSEF